MAKCAYTRGANCKGAPNRTKVAFLSYNKIEIFPLCSLKYVDVVCLYTFRVNLMMKIAQGHLNKKFRMKKLLTNLPVVKGEKQMFKV
jgi:hypothetical protein